MASQSGLFLLSVKSNISAKQKTPLVSFVGWVCLFCDWNYVLRKNSFMYVCEPENHPVSRDWCRTNHRHNHAWMGYSWQLTGMLSVCLSCGRRFLDCVESRSSSLHGFHISAAVMLLRFLVFNDGFALFEKMNLDMRIKRLCVNVTAMYVYVRTQFLLLLCTTELPLPYHHTVLLARTELISW